MMIKCFFYIILLFMTTVINGQGLSEKNVINYVDPFIGSLGDGNVFVGTCLPHGFVKLGPDTRFNSGASGYKKYKDIEGFSHLHISGMGGPLYGNIQLLPTTGDVLPFEHYSSLHNEFAKPGYYKVRLTKYNTVAELTSTAHCGFHRYTFPKCNFSHILVDVGATLYGINQSWNSSQPIGGEIHVDSVNRQVWGYNRYKGGRSTCKPWTVYFFAEFDTRFDSFGTWNDSLKCHRQSYMQGNEIGAYLRFNTKSNQQIKVKVGISMISVDKAKTSLKNEIPDWNFERIRELAEIEWTKELEKIELQGGSEEENRIFYTALYHSLLSPSDWTGENNVFDYKRPYYEDFLCIWDIYRTVCPLLALISTDKYVDMLNSLLDVYRHDGWLADAHSSLQREFTQVGSNSDVLFADAFVKKINGIDYELAYEAIKKNATDTSFLKQNIAYAGRPGLSDYIKYKYIPTDVGQKITVSRTLEYIYDDFCIYQLALKYGTEDDVALFKDRCLWYRNLWDKNLKLMRGRKINGNWSSPFYPSKVETGINFYEGHAYTWSYSVPHDVKGLIKLFGSEKQFSDSLAYVMSNHYEAYNEPGMLQAYLFVWAGRPDLTQKYIRKAISDNFSDKYDGLPGNDDSGTTSAWYLWSRMGIFPVAGQNLYIIGSPSNKEIIIHLESGNILKISAYNASEKNIYIQSAKFNGREYNKAFFTHDDIVNGAHFEFIMGDKPSNWGATQIPCSFSDN